MKAEKKYQADVVVIGGGIAGIVTALELLDRGRKVLILDRDGRERFGGQAITAFGGMMLVGTPLQKLLGVRDSADLAVALGLPVIVVVGLRLGCLNHALLTAEAIAARGLTLAGWVANRIDPDMLRAEDNIAALRERLGAPLLGSVPSIAGSDPAAAASFLDLPPRKTGNGYNSAP